MSWYNYKEWKNSIKKQKNTNTPRALIRGITKFIASKDIDWHRSEGRDYRDYTEVLNASLRWFISHSDLANTDLYNLIRNIAVQTSGNNDSLDYVKDLEEQISTCMPYWFAYAIVNKEVSIPKDTAFNDMSYDIDNDVIADFRYELPHINVNILLEHSHLDDKHIFIEFLNTRSKDELLSLLSRMNYFNMTHIDTDLLNEICIKYDFGSLKDIASSMTNPINLFKCSISAMKMFEECYDIWKFIRLEIIMDSIVKNPLLTTQEFIDISTISGSSRSNYSFRNLALSKPHIIMEMIHNGDTSPTFDLMAWLSYSKDITINDVLENISLEWNWEILSRNPVISTPDNIKTHISLPWKWGKWGISASPSLTEEFIEENFDLLCTDVDRCFGGSILNNSSVTIKNVELHPEVDWDYRFNGLSSNPNVSIPYFLKNIDKNWDIISLVEKINVCEDTAIRAIQACWRIYKTHQKAKWLAHQVVEWSYHPDCKPAMNIRKRHFEENMNSLIM